MSRIAFFIYGLVCYLIFLAFVFPYAVGFLGNFGVPTSLDSVARQPWQFALTIDFLLLGTFALQHSVMARPWFKTWWTRYIPREIERSTYVLFSNVAMVLIFTFWQPLGVEVWRISGVAKYAIYAVYGLGWATILYSTFLINHFDLFGLRQVWLNLRGIPYTPLPFREPSLYRYVRHPLYVGWILVFWFTPMMTASHLVFAVTTTAYILIAIQFEERDLSSALDGYRAYRRRVPMLIPKFGGSRDDALQECKPVPSPTVVREG